MFSKIPQNIGSANDAVNQPAEFDREVDEQTREHSDRHSDVVHQCHGNASELSSAESVASVAQMAFLQLMARKVMEATVNSPEAVKLMNSAIRRDKL